MYSDYENGIEKKTLSESLRKSPIHTNPDFPAPESLDTRYISEDLPFGLVPWSSIAQMWNIKTPTLDAVIQIASTMLEKDYFMEGITVKDLGIEKMSPDEVKQMLT